VPSSRYGGSEDVDWRRFLRRVRLEAAVKGPLDPVTTIPDGERDSERPRVVIARHLVKLANLWARAHRGDAPAASEICGITSGVLALWDHASQVERRGLWAALDGRRTIIEGAVVLAGEVGRDRLEALWQWWQNRWAAAGHGRDGGLRLVRAFADEGIGALSLRTRLDAYAEALEDDPDADPEEWTELASARISADDEVGARKALERCMALTFAVGYRKDYQLSTWVRLLRPLLHGQGGRELAAWLVERISDLQRRAEGGAAHHAAETLVGVVGEARPADVLALGQALRDVDAFDVDDIVTAILRATATFACEAWWIVIREILVPLGGGPIELDTACAATPERDLLVRRLREVTERVAVEGRPTERRAWRRALVEAGRARRIPPTALGIADPDLEIGDETPNREAGGTQTDADTAREQTPEPVEELLARLEAGDLGYEGLRPGLRRLAEFDGTQRDRLLALAEDDEVFTPLAAELAKEAIDTGHVDDAWQWAERALICARGHDWVRHYSGGPALEASRILQRLDASRARPRIFESFAAAVQDRFLLGSLADELDRTVDVFDPVDEHAVAQVVMEYVSALSGVPPPDLCDRAPGDSAPVTPEPEHHHVTVTACAEVVAWLLAMVHLIAWTSAQRAAVALLREGGTTAEATQDVLLADEFDIPPERLLAVFRAALRASNTTVPDPDEVIGWLTAQAVGTRLDLREAAGCLLRCLGIGVPEPRGRPLPAGLHLVVPRAPEIFTSASTVGAGDLDDMLDNFAASIQDLARVADVDPEALVERIRARAKQIAASLPSDREMAAQRTVLGWGFLRPSSTAVAAAQHEAAAELVDAGRVSPADALTAVGTLPCDFADALICRPERRPSCVQAATPFVERSLAGRDWLDGIAQASDRLASGCDSWTVIAELTELSLLDRRHPREEREQALLADEARTLYTPVRLSLDDRAAGPLRPRASLIMRNLPARPSMSLEFIALHPAAASAAGLEPDDDDPFAWRLDGNVVVRSLWWRSGFLSWQPYSERDEVGVGWLVLARPAALDALLQVFPGARIGWVVRRRLLAGDGAGEMPARIDAGERILPGAPGA
jgi:hypothetical protein